MPATMMKETSPPSYWPTLLGLASPEVACTFVSTLNRSELASARTS
jgi:hypothetical protein